MGCAIIDYQAGNLASVKRALDHLGVESLITSDPAVVASAERVIFPGVGAAGACMANLKASGLDQALRQAVASGRPVLGICIGMQLLFEWSDEDGGVPCLGLLPGTVRRFVFENPSLKVPHMGWNPVEFTPGEPLARGLPADGAFYFVHSYFCQPVGLPPMAQAVHGLPFCCGIRRSNLVAVQFHPEKSGPLGLRLLANFME